MPPPRQQLGARLRDGARIAFFLDVPRERFAPDWVEVVSAALLTVCIPTLFSVLLLGDEGRWATWQAPQVLFHIPLALIACVAAAWLVGREDAVPVLLFAAFLAGVVIDVLALAAWALAVKTDVTLPFDIEPVLAYGPLAWLSLALARYAIRLAPTPGGRQAGVLVAIVVFLAVPLALAHPERSLWVRDWSLDPNAPPRWSAANEEAFYRQPELLARELAAVRPGRKGVVDLFFVGMAGDGQQDVFMREIEAVAALMRERFDAEGRVVKLVNNPKTLLRTPIASGTSLRSALRRIAQVMDVEEDVLFLFITSHGSDKHRLALELWPLQLHELDPPTLRSILDASGIVNRVVVVSACYSGGFVEALKDDHTLVIAAAARDRNSFGCSNEAWWTYFGKAYFDEALRNTHSFTRAFEMSLPVIAEREKARKFEPSNPQMVVGDAVRGRLEALEARLARLPDARNATTKTR